MKKFLLMFGLLTALFIGGVTEGNAQSISCTPNSHNFGGLPYVPPPTSFTRQYGGPFNCTVSGLNTSQVYSVTWELISSPNVGGNYLFWGELGVTACSPCGAYPLGDGTMSTGGTWIPVEQWDLNNYSVGSTQYASGRIRLRLGEGETGTILSSQVISFQVTRASGPYD